MALQELLNIVPTAVMQDEPQVKRLKLANDPTFTIYVGSPSNGGQQAFYIHKSWLCDASSYFRSACTAKFEDGEERACHLPGESPEVFERFFAWVYRAPLPEKLDLPEICSLYTLAHTLDAPRLKNDLMDIWMRAPKLGDLSIRQVDQLWGSLPERSEARKTIVDYLVWKVRSDVYAQDPQSTRIFASCSQAFVVEVMLKMAGRAYGQAENPFKYPLTCRYHEHKEEERVKWLGKCPDRENPR